MREILLNLKHVRMTDFHPFRECTRFCNIPCQMVYFLSLHPSLTIEPAHFLKIYGEILPRSRLSDTTRFSTLLDYWWIVADPFSSDIHCMTRFFTYALPPPMPSFFHFTLPIQFPLIIFLGWEQGVGRRIHYT